jgi:uncharacterized protein YgbK (DUF1537 family)
MGLVDGTESVAAVAQQALDWARPRLGQQPILIYSTATPEALQAVQNRLGVEQAGARVEATLAKISQGLVEAGVGQLIVAGGETSGAVVQALGMTQLQIGTQIDPGVPWCAGRTQPADKLIHVTLKSGNFGRLEFFTQAFERIQAS